MSDPTVLIVEDDADLRRLLRQGLGEEGFATAEAGSGRAALEAVDRQDPDALVIDIGLPDADGRDLCQALRAKGCQAPVIFLTARDAVSDRLSGFSAGGDDYLTKPFVLAELVARLQALLRRSGGGGGEAIDGLELDPVTHGIRVDGRDTALTPTEFRILATLVAQPGAAIRRRELIRAAWPEGAIVHDNTLDVYVARLRRKLRDLDSAPVIETVRGIGYRLK